MSISYQDREKINLQDALNLASEFSIDLEFVSNAITLMKKIRDENLPSLMQEYNIIPLLKE